MKPKKQLIMNNFFGDFFCGEINKKMTFISSKGLNNQAMCDYN